jgi:hypothetical protein
VENVGFQKDDEKMEVRISLHNSRFSSFPILQEMFMSAIIYNFSYALYEYINFK